MSDENMSIKWECYVLQVELAKCLKRVDLNKFYGGEFHVNTTLRRSGHLAQSGVSLTANQGGAGSSPGPATYIVEIYHEIISMVILPLPLIQEGQMSVSGESMCTKYWLTA